MTASAGAPGRKAGVRVKVCGLTRQEDVDAAAALGADLVGFIFHGPSPRNVSPEAVADLVTPQGVTRVGVFVRQDAAEVGRVMEAARLDLAQLAGDQDEVFCRAVGPGRVMRVFWPERHAQAASSSLSAELARFSGLVCFALLDAGLWGGGSGQSLDFAALAGLRPPAPWWLAGGLGPANLARALAVCSPYGVDLNSGVESAPGVKDPDKLARAMEVIRSVS